jgi:hypothetical protein
MKRLFAALLLSLAMVAPAKAEVFVWKDPTYNVRVAYPDNWMRQAQLDDDLRFFILAPQGTGHAACRLYITHDGRYMDAPAAYGQQVSAMVFDESAIEREVFARPDTDMVQVASINNGASLGSGAAVLAHVDFQKNWNGRSFPMHAMVLASQYHGDHMIMSCEALAADWQSWEPTMQGILKSVSFPPAFTSTPNGFYRAFQNDGGVILPLNRRKDGVTTR